MINIRHDQKYKVISVQTEDTIPEKISQMEGLRYVMLPQLVQYFGLINHFINPDGDRDGITLYNAAGTDIASGLLLFNTTRIYLVSNNYNGLNSSTLATLPRHEWKRDWESFASLKKVCTREEAQFVSEFLGYMPVNVITSLCGTLLGLRLQLEALSINIESVVVDQDPLTSCARLNFSWAYPGLEPKLRHITFVYDEDVRRPICSSAYETLLKHGIRYYLHKAAMSLPKEYYFPKNFMTRIITELEPLGFSLTDDILSENDTIPDRYIFKDLNKEFPAGLNNIILPKHSILDSLSKHMYENRLWWNEANFEELSWSNYGWRLNIRQKPLV